MKEIKNSTKVTVCNIIALIASIVLVFVPVFSFSADQGIIYLREFVMTTRTFSIVQTELATGKVDVLASMSVRGLFYCAWGMVIVSLICLLCYMRRWKRKLSLVVVYLSAIFYILMVYYAIKMADTYYATFYPNLATILPAIVIQTMLIIRKETKRAIIDSIGIEEEERSLHREHRHHHHHHTPHRATTPQKE